MAAKKLSEKQKENNKLTEYLSANNIKFQIMWNKYDPKGEISYYIFIPMYKEKKKRERKK